jgi:hypothetical protein
LPPAIYDEALLPAYHLPPLLRCEDGRLVDSVARWREQRRPELLELFRTQVYGRFELELNVDVSPVVTDASACGGLARRTELDVTLSSPARGAGPTLRVLIFRPSAGPARVPAFLGLNLFGNHTVHPDPGIRLAQGWLPVNAELGLEGHVATDASRGMHAARFPIEMLLTRGYALVTAYVGDIDPDFDDGFHNGLHGLLSPTERAAGDAPGTIAAWAFGLSRIRDALAQLGDIDAERVAVFGHSRLGKSALWAAAQDERFGLAISNQSGCLGAALSRRCYGERLLHINERFPHWFCRNLRAFNEREESLPVDQHQLLALVAPRPLYVASAASDLWADPRGEKLACQAASPIYELFGDEPWAEQDVQRSRSGGRIGYHQRPGRHDITPRDFWHYLEFADAQLRLPTPTSSTPGAGSVPTSSDKGNPAVIGERASACPLPT